MYGMLLAPTWTANKTIIMLLSKSKYENRWFKSHKITSIRTADNWSSQIRQILQTDGDYVKGDSLPVRYSFVCSIFWYDLWNLKIDELRCPMPSKSVPLFPTHPLKKTPLVWILAGLKYETRWSRIYLSWKKNFFPIPSVLSTSFFRLAYHLSFWVLIMNSDGFRSLPVPKIIVF